MTDTVTQEAREAAAAWHEVFDPTPGGDYAIGAQKIRDGKCDHMKIVQAFTRFQQEIEQKAWEEARELIRGTNADMCKSGRDYRREPMKQPTLWQRIFRRV